MVIYTFLIIEEIQRHIFRRNCKNTFFRLLQISQAIKMRKKGTKNVDGIRGSFIGHSNPYSYILKYHLT